MPTGDHGSSPAQSLSRRAFHTLMLATLGGAVGLQDIARAASGQSGPETLYRYEIGEALSAEDLGRVAPLLPQEANVLRAKVVSPGQARPLAELDFAETAQGRVLLEWRARVDDPFLTLTAPLEEVAALAEVLQRHVSQQSVLLAWWDLARAFHLLARVPVSFPDYLGVPLFVPKPWKDQAAAVQAIEESFWGNADAAHMEAEQVRFAHFTDALLAPEAVGMAGLRALADGKPAVLVLHLRDVILLGHMAPDRLGVAFRDFGAMGAVHGMVRSVRGWMKEHEYAAYSALRKDGQVRALALTDEPSTQTLVARLLPFIGNDQTDVAGATLVYQAGGFVVFEIQSADGVSQVPRKDGG